MSELINPVYLENHTQDQLSQHFLKDSAFHSVSMTQFFTKNGLEQILNEIIEAEFVPDMVEIKHRRSRAETTPSLNELINSKEFQEILTKVTGQDLNISRESKFVHKYGHRDYKIIHDEAVLDPGYDIIIDLTPEWVDDLGGYVAYTDGEGQFYTIGSNFGSVSIIERDENHHYFVKYVNHYADNLNRYLVILNSNVER